MNYRNVWNAGLLSQWARELTPLQRQIVLSLRDRGPGLPLEIAVRVLKFPEEVSQPIADLQEKEIVVLARVSGGSFGGEMISLSAMGEQLANLLRSENFIESNHIAPPQPARSIPKPQEQEIELLKRLGDLARDNGDPQGAHEYYQQALDVTRELSRSTSTP